MPVQRVYLDYNASAPLIPAVREAIISVLDVFGNPSSVHEEGRQARQYIEKARDQVAGLVHGLPEHVIFTSGASEAAAMFLHPYWKQGKQNILLGHLYRCVADHPCFLSYRGFSAEQVSSIGVDSDGVIDLDCLTFNLKNHKLSQGKPLVCVHAVNNETGVIQPFLEIAAAVQNVGGIFILDAVQAVGRIPLDMAVSLADHVVISSHKIGGPKGIGAVVSKDYTLMPYPLISGGGQEGGYRAGTENVTSSVGFGMAASIASKRLEQISDVRALRDRFETVVTDICPDSVIHSKNAPRVANTSLFSIPDVQAETLQIACDLAGISLSSGSACSSGITGSSHVLKAMTKSFSQGALRLSIGYETTENDLDVFRSVFSDIMKRYAER